MHLKILVVILMALFLLPTVPAQLLLKPIGYVNDFANIIDQASEQTITRLVTEIHQQTTVEISVVTLDKLDDVSLEDYAFQLAQAWGIGKKGTDNGLLLLIIPSQRAYRIEIGKGLEGVINDAKAGRIGRQILAPNFQRNQYGKGIYEALIEIKGLLEKNPEVVARYTQEPIPPAYIYLALLYGIITFIITFYAFESKKLTWKTLVAWDALTLSIAFFLTLLLPALIIVLITLFLAIHLFTTPLSGGRHRGFGGGGILPGTRTGLGGFGGFGGGSFGGGGASGRF